MKVIFMGTPEFAVPALKILPKSGHEIVLVVTQPDRPKGRGRKVLPSPVKKVALDLRYDVSQPKSIRTAEFAQHIKKLKPDIIVVVAFGHILTKDILSLPRIGTINIHASLLPKYRGPAPIQWAIINAEKETGVTTMFMNEGLDTGDILLAAKTEIFPDDNAATLHDRLSELGADLLSNTIQALEAGDIKPVPQNHEQATYAPLLTKTDGHIDWEKPADLLEVFIRGMTPWPGAYTFHGEKRLRIFRARPITTEVSDPPGTVIKGFSGELRIVTAKGILSILEIQGASGKRLLIKDFLRGTVIPPGTVLT
ncbi:methionyl-tRNA formyltransferase [Thermodesulfobacteriota bacterium]